MTFYNRSYCSDITAMLYYSQPFFGKILYAISLYVDALYLSRGIYGGLFR